MAAMQLPIDLPEQAVTRRELLAHLEFVEDTRREQQERRIVQELERRNYATNDEVRATVFHFKRFNSPPLPVRRSDGSHAAPHRSPRAGGYSS